jgi:hypothetical protein
MDHAKTVPGRPLNETFNQRVGSFNGTLGQDVDSGTCSPYSSKHQGGLGVERRLTASSHFMPLA